MDQISGRLLELQTIDERIRATRERVESYSPMIAAVEEPVRRLEKEVEVTTERVRDLHLEERRMRLSAEEKRLRVQRLKDREVRTLRQEAAVQAELGLVNRALEREELDVLSLLDQVAKFEDRLETHRLELDEARAAVESERTSIARQEEEARAELAALEESRERFAAEINPPVLAIYNSLARSGRPVVVTRMTENGACGACFSRIPLQLQNEIRTKSPLVRCEACGVIVTVPLSLTDPSPEESAEVS